jgi:cytochrome c-type biogenesis protein CcmH/NrfF
MPETAPRTRRVAAAFIVALVLLIPMHAGWAHAQDADASLQERSLAIERQLLCPQCTSKRVDVCDLEICDDMRRVIREQLVAGASSDDIIQYFENRYGPRILAEVPKEGFNLVLFGWVAGWVLLIAGAGAFFMIRLRRPPPVASAGSRAGDFDGDTWLDEELAAFAPDGDDSATDGGR